MKDVGETTELGGVMYEGGATGEAWTEEVEAGKVYRGAACLAGALATPPFEGVRPDKFRSMLKVADV